jgi:hypothetical protein
MIEWLIRFLSVPTAGKGQNLVAKKDGHSLEGTPQRERRLVVDESTALAELMRLLDKQLATGKSKANREDRSDS